MSVASRSASKPQVSLEEIADFCRRHQVSKLYLFGSVLTDEFDEQSDVDVMIETPVTHRLRETNQMVEELSAMFGRRIDLVTRTAVEASPSKTRRESILGSAKVVFAAA